MWHFGRRDRGHMLLLPPILCDDGAFAMAEGVVRLRDETGLEVLPENPPGAFYIGDLHLLDYYARVCERSDTGQVLDCAHLASDQQIMGHSPLTGLDGFPFERIVELHMAGGTPSTREGYPFVEDDHNANVLDDTWAIFEAVVARAPNIKAVVFECERNRLESCLPGFERMAKTLGEARDCS